jgi:putative DNA primase/helicase
VRVPLISNAEEKHMDTSDFAVKLADKLIAQLKDGSSPWQKPWKDGQAFGPYNPTTGNRYRGVNIVALMATDFTDPRWMTYKQAQSHGWQVKRGEKAAQIQHWIWEQERVRLGENGQPELDSQGKPIRELVRLERPKVIGAAVFNAQQIEGIPALEAKRNLEWNHIEQAEKLLKASNARIQHSAQGGAFYRLATDTIHLPNQDRFSNAGDYYSTALHELGHWSGHPDRLDRDLENPFGSAGYAREELRAEIASLILGSELGIGYDPSQHASYVDHWIQILTESPKEILYAAADAERISEYILRIEERQKAGTQETHEARQAKRDLVLQERIYLTVPYDERNEAKALGARWDAVKKAWYIGPEVDPVKLAKWELQHQPEPTLDPRAEFAAVLRSIGGIVDGEHPIMNGEAQRISAHDDKRGERTIFYVAHGDGVPGGYAENNRTKEVVRWKARGQLLSQEVKAEMLAQAEQKRYTRRHAQQQMYEATSKRLSEEIRGLGFSSETTDYHKAKQIDARFGAPVRAGDLLVPGYDLHGKLWTVQYIKADGTKRFAKDSRKHGCFHVVGAPNSAVALQKIALSPVVVIAEGYATAATIAEQPNVCVLAAFDSGNLLAVATALRERHRDKVIVIAGDDDHRLENNPGRTKALEAAAAVKGVAIFPQLSAEQKERGMTDFNDLASQTPEIVATQFQEVFAGTARQERKSEVSGKMEKEVLRTMLSRSSRGAKGQVAYASKHIIRGKQAQSVELDRDI